MESLIKYFELKHNISELMKEEINKSEKLKVFFNVVLEYYYIHNIPLDYTDVSVSIDVKDIIIKNVYPIIYSEKSGKMFDLVDFMFKTLKKIMKRTHVGYLDSLGKFGAVFSFTKYIIPSIDLFFYIIFVHVFPEELRDLLRVALKLSDIEYKILNKCSDILIKENSKICDLRNPISSPSSSSSSPPSSSSYPPSSPINVNLQIDSIKSKSMLSSPIKKSGDLSIDKSMGFMMLLKMFMDLREFKNRI